MSYKQLNGEKNYGSITSSSAHSQLLELSGEVESEGDEELEFKKRRVSPVTVMRYFGATMCLIIMVLSCKLAVKLYRLMYIWLLKKPCWRLFFCVFVVCQFTLCICKCMISVKQTKQDLLLIALYIYFSTEDWLNVSNRFNQFFHHLKLDNLFAAADVVIYK